MKALFKHLNFYPCGGTLLAALLAIPQIPLQGSISNQKAVAQQASCPAGTTQATLNWGTTNFQTANFNQTFNIGGVSTNFQMTENPAGFIRDQPPQVIGPVPYGVVPGPYGGINSPYLRWGIDATQNRDGNSTLTITFAQPVTLPVPLTLLDVDRDRQDELPYQDQVTVTASNQGQNVPVTLTNIGSGAVAQIVSANVARGADPRVGPGNSPNDQNLGNVFATFAQPVTQIRIVYQSGPLSYAENQRPQQDETIGLADLTICASSGTGSIGDTVFNDTNGNGQQDPGEPGVGNVPLTLTLPGPDGQLGTADDTTQTTNTNASGNYSFTNLPAGPYRVSVTPPANFSEVTTTGGRQVDVTLNSGQSLDTVDFGLRQPLNSIGDTVFNDTNGNGQQDPGEPGVGNVPLTLTLPGADGQLGTADDTTQTTNTNANGNYSFTNLPPGPYRVSVTPPFNLPDVTTGGGRQVDVTLNPGQSLDTVDFGLRRPPGGTIGDFVFTDRNGNGSVDNGDRGIANVTLTLRNSSGQVVSTTRTDNNGNYLFTGLQPGNYTVEVTQPSDFTATTSTTLTANITDANSENLNIDFGFRPGQAGASGETNLRIVKRITNALRNGQPINGVSFNTFINDPNNNDDDRLQQAGRSPVGQINLQPPLSSGDQVEYTVYFLADGTQQLQNARFCDLIPAGTSYVSNSLSVNGISNQGQVLSPLAPLQDFANICGGSNNQGAVVVGPANIPGGQTGLIRFRVTVD
ncbi:MAG: carboxypeptidase regulatory-like domain-containing protein [Fischerella sp. CENA71]|nr:carboxypeptidase regulatory-like domain-containing protein [Fischerella sp. CENA71]